MTVYTVYKIVNTKNQRVYIGMTSKEVAVRFKAHLSQSKKPSSNELHKDLLLYGVENFYFEILEQSEDERYISERECYWIMHLNTLAPNGYNINKFNASEIAPVISISDPRVKIRSYLDERGIFLRWLSQKIDINQSHLSRILWGKRKLTSATLEKINQALNTDFKS